MTPTNNLPNPYRTIEGWAKLPEGRTWGSTSAVDIDNDGKSIWVAERCGTNSCVGSKLDPSASSTRAESSWRTSARACSCRRMASRRSRRQRLGDRLLVHGGVARRGRRGSAAGSDATAAPPPTPRDTRSSSSAPTASC